MHASTYRGVFPVVPTIFDASGGLDLEGQRRAVDFMIDAGSHGLCILANFSEQFVLTDAERETIMEAVLAHVAGRVPVIVTTTHFSTAVCAARSRRAQDLGAAMVMIMPPYHGATFRVGEPAIYEFYRAVSDAIDIPIMVQDAPAAGTPLSAPFLARMAARDRASRVFQGGGRAGGGEAAHAHRVGRRGDRGALGWGGGHHADGRSGCGRDGDDDRRRAIRTGSGRSSTRISRVTGRRRWRLMRAGCR